jgi:hypothetical protein
MIRMEEIADKIPRRFDTANLHTTTYNSQYGEYSVAEIKIDGSTHYVRVDFKPDTGFITQTKNLLGMDTTQSVELEGVETIEDRINLYPEHVGRSEALLNAMAEVVKTEYYRNCRFHKALNQVTYGMALARSDWGED